MKQRQFHLRQDLDEAGNMRRLYSYIQSLKGSAQPSAKMKTATQLKRIAKLTRVK